MAKSSEDVLLVVPHVKNKKCEGTLYMMSERLAWMPATKQIFTVSHGYIDIKTQKISPDAKDKIQLQVVLQQGGASTFHFANPDGRKRQMDERDSIKELLQQLLPRFRLKITSEMEEKNRIMMADPDLYQLYKDLVVGNVISSEEFWANRTVRPKATDNSRQDVGVSAAFLADIKPKADGCNGLRYDLTPDIIESIFRTYPTVRQKHFENVPDKLTEEEFWTRFFQSHYFHRDYFNLTSKDLFTDCARKDEQALKVEIETAPKDSLVDLAKMTDNSWNDSYGLEDVGMVGPVVPNANTSLIKRFNQHSTMVLKSCDRQSAAVVDADAKADETTVVNGSVENVSHITYEDMIIEKQTKIKEKIEYNDLSDTYASNGGPPALKLARLDPYMHGPTPVVAMQYNTSEDMINACQAFTQDLLAWQRQITQVLSGNSAINVLWELSPGGALMQSCTQQQLQEMISADVQLELKNLYYALCELLRHFWTCFPTTTKALEEKVLRMREALLRFQKNKLIPFGEKVSNQHYTVNLIGHMDSMLETAFMKFANWQAKRSQLTGKRT